MTIEALQVEAVSPDSVQPNSQLTVPRSYGMYEMTGDVDSIRRFRYGNNPIRMRELEAEFTNCALKFLFLTRETTVAAAFILNGRRR